MARSISSGFAAAYSNAASKSAGVNPDVASRITSSDIPSWRDLTSPQTVMRVSRTHALPPQRSGFFDIQVAVVAIESPPRPPACSPSLRDLRHQHGAVVRERPAAGELVQRPQHLAQQVAGADGAVGEHPVQPLHAERLAGVAFRLGDAVGVEDDLVTGDELPAAL